MLRATTDQFTGLVKELQHPSGRRRPNRVLHFHGLHDHESISLGHELAGLDQQQHHRAIHRRAETLLGNATAGVTPLRRRQRTVNHGAVQEHTESIANGRHAKCAPVTVDCGMQAVAIEVAGEHQRAPVLRQQPPTRAALTALLEFDPVNAPLEQDVQTLQARRSLAPATRELPR